MDIASIIVLLLAALALGVFVFHQDDGDDDEGGSL